MTDQHATNAFQPPANGRFQEPIMSVPYYNNVQRIVDTGNIPSTASYYPLFYRNDRMQPIYNPMNPHVMYQFSPQMPDGQLSGAVPNAPPDFNQISVNPQAYQQQIPYTHMVPQNPSVIPPYNATGEPAKPKNLQASREKKPLLIIDPRTHDVVNLQETEQGKVESIVPVSSQPQRLDSDSHVSVNVEKPLVKDNELVPPTAEKTTATVIDEDKNVAVAVPVEAEEDKPAPVINAAAVVATASTSELSNTDSSSEDDESDTDYTGGRRIYNRSLMLECKNSPIASVQLQELAAYFMNYNKPRKGHGMSNRSARVIRLPAGIAVKRVEGAFVPTKLRKEKDEDASEQKQLSRRLNIILNRVSDGNVADTVAEIKKLKIAKPEDLQLLATLIFEKGIRQQKYIEVFAKLCEEFKGFFVPGCESLDCLILKKTQELFNKPLETIISELNATIDEKIANAKDETTKNILEEDRESTVLKKTEAYYGNVYFVCNLYLRRMISLKTICGCLRRLVESQAPEALDSMLILLNICGKDLDSNAKSIVDASFNRLELISKSDKIPLHQVYKIGELVQLRARKWSELEAKPQQAQRNGKSKPVAPVQDTKRRSMQPGHAVKPSTLAVSQPSHNSPSLRPVNSANWQMGAQQNREIDAPGPANIRSVTASMENSSYRSREASPRVVPNAWVTPLTARLAAQDTKTEAYPTVLSRNQASAREFVTVSTTNPDSSIEAAKQCKASERHALLHAVLDQVMEKQSQYREAVGNLISRMLSSQIIKESDLMSGCAHFFESCDDDWLEDYPLGWKLVAEVLHHLLQKEDCRFGLLAEILAPIATDDRAATVMAHCMQLSLKHLDKSILQDAWRKCGLSWASLGLNPSDHTFISKQFPDLSFTLPNAEEDLLQKFSTLVDSQKLEALQDFIREAASQDLSPTFIPQCIRILVPKSQDFTSSEMDRLMVSLSIMVDHQPIREQQVLQGLEECSVDKSLTDRWIKSLMNRKVISADALTSCGNWNNLVARTNPVRDL